MISGLYIEQVWPSLLYRFEFALKYVKNRFLSEHILLTDMLRYDVTRVGRKLVTQ